MNPRLSRFQQLVSLLFIAVCLQVGVAVCHLNKPLPKGISFRGDPRLADQIRFLKDVTYLDTSGKRQCQQEIFEAVFDVVDRAESFVLVDMFLFNPFLGEEEQPYRRLSSELTERLIAKKTDSPAVQVTVITDPINDLYGGYKSEHLRALQAAGIRVVFTSLERLRDSSPFYSAAWRVFGQWWGNSATGWAPNPFGEGRVSWRGYGHLLNFKANHRKMIAADDDRGLIGIVTSGNPHDGSSAHENVAIEVRGDVVRDLIRVENAVLSLSGEEPLSIAPPSSHEELFLGEDEPTVWVASEKKIKESILHAVEATAAGDRIDLVMFYFSDRDLLDAVVRAQSRGTRVRVMLDPNRDAFGREKSGLPNRPVAHELHRADVGVRWRETHGEQCHSKLILVRYRDERTFLSTGSANFTRRNLDDFNLELNLVVTGSSDASVFASVREYIEMLWTNQDDRLFTVPYENYADASPLRSLLYRAMEQTGVCTF